jgi:hypothetical protein
MARTVDLAISREELAELLLSGEICDVIGSPAAVNCSRCGRPYDEHPHSATEARTMRAQGQTHSLHAFRTQNDVGLWLTGRRVDGLLYEPDGKWDRG